MDVLQIVDYITNTLMRIEQNKDEKDINNFRQETMAMLKDLHEEIYNLYRIEDYIKNAREEAESFFLESK